MAYLQPDPLFSLPPSIDNWYLRLMTMRIRLFADQLSVKSDDQSSIQSGDSSGANRVKFLYSYGGRILPRPADRKLRYVGGETRVMAADRNVTLADLIAKMAEGLGSSMVLKCRLPTEDLDALVSIKSDEDLDSILEEYERLGAKQGFSKVRAFLFPKPSKPPVATCYRIAQGGGYGQYYYNSPVRYANENHNGLTMRPQQNSVRRARTVHSRNSYQYPSPPPPPPPSAQMPLTGKATKDPQQHRKPAAYHNILRSPYPGVAFRPHDQLLAVQQ